MTRGRPKNPVDSPGAPRPAALARRGDLDLVISVFSAGETPSCPAVCWRDRLGGEFRITCSSSQFEFAAKCQCFGAFCRAEFGVYTAKSCVGRHMTQTEPGNHSGTTFQDIMPIPTSLKVPAGTRLAQRLCNFDNNKTYLLQSHMNWLNANVWPLISSLDGPWIDLIGHASRWRVEPPRPKGQGFSQYASIPALALAYDGSIRANILTAPLRSALS